MEISTAPSTPMTPRYGSWLDMAESERAVLATQCLDGRIPDKPTLISEVVAWQTSRNTAPKPTGHSQPTQPSSS